MNSPEIHIIKVWHETLNNGDAGRLVALSHPNAELGGPRGAGYGANLLHKWVDRAGIRLELQRIFHRTDTAIVEQEAEWSSADAGQVTGSQMVASVFMVRDGQVISVIRYPDLAKALNAAGLDESHEVLNNS